MKDTSIKWQIGYPEKANERKVIVSINSWDGRNFTDVAKPTELGWQDVHGDIHLYSDNIVAWAELPEPVLINIINS